MFRQGGVRQLRYAEQGYVGVRFILAVEARHGGASSERACLGSLGTLVRGTFRCGLAVTASSVGFVRVLFSSGSLVELC